MVEDDERHLEGSLTVVGGEGGVIPDLVKVVNDWKVIAFNGAGSWFGDFHKIGAGGITEENSNKLLHLLHLRPEA